MVRKLSGVGKRILLVISLLTVAIVFSSCSGSGGSDDGVRGTSVELDYQSSSAGPLITSFEIGPRSEIQEFGEFYALIYLENQGSQDLTQGEISLRAAYSDGLVEWHTESIDGIKLLGYNSENVAIDDDIFEFDGFVGTLPEGNSELEVTIFATANFHYNTILEQEVCINPAMYDVVDGNCQNPSSDVHASSQYSPVVVSTFEQDVDGRSGKTYFLFNIENSGYGEVNEISVVDAQITGEDMVCQFVDSGDATGESDGDSYTFGSGESSVRLDCVHQFDPNEPAMEKVLYLDLSYDYSLQDTETIKIVESRTSAYS